MSPSHRRMPSRPAMRLALQALLIVLFVASLPAQQAPVTAAGDSSRVMETFTGSPGSMGPAILKTILMLILILAMVYLGTYTLKRFLHSKRRDKGIPIDIIGTRHLDPKKAIYLVDIEEKRLVLGVTESSITCLAELKRKPGQNMLPAEVEGKRSFREYWDLFRKRGRDD